MKRVLVSGGFDDLRSPEVRFLQEAARLGPVQVLLWSDDVLRRLEEKTPKFPQAERLYMLQSLRYVHSAAVCEGDVHRNELPPSERFQGSLWAVDQSNGAPEKQEYCRTHGIEYRVLLDEDLAGFAEECLNSMDASPRKRVIVSGCFDWFHSGHVRFFEEVSALGDLYVVVGHDANIELLKGKGHPMHGQQERRYMVQSVRFVKQALISSGNGWLDAEPEMERIKPDIYAVNEDGDRPEKRRYCQAHGIEYRVLKRVPKEGLPRRVSTELRGF